jgi:hypothetical protein
MGGKTLSDAQFFAVLNADVVEMIDGEESTTKRRYFRIAENDESITFSCILGSSQQQMVVTKATKQLNVSTTSILSGQPGSITSEMLADKAVTRKKLDDAAVGSEALGNASVTSVKINNGAVTSEKLAPGLDVSGLFFILPKGTKFPYTLTEGDKKRLANARFLVCVGPDGSISVTLHPATLSYVGSWFGVYSTSKFLYIGVTESVINTPSSISLYDLNSVKFNAAQNLTDAQKLQARTNIGAAKDPNTSGDSQATLEEPPVAD